MLGADSRIVKEQESLTLPDNSSQEKKDRWSKVLGTFHLHKEVFNFENEIRQKIPHSKKKSTTTNQRSRSTRRKILCLSSFINTMHLNESEIVWSSSSEEDSCLRLDAAKKLKKSQQTGCSLSNEFENEKINSLCKRSASSGRHVKHNSESEIHWSSSNESSDENVSGREVSLQCIFQNQMDSDCELNEFVKEIQKDLRRSKIIEKKKINKGGYLEGFRKALNKSKADTTFLDYEHKAEIIRGNKGLIKEIEVCYGSKLANVHLDSGTNCYIFLGKHMQSNVDGSAIVCFFEDSRFYTANNRNVYIQPNKVIAV